MKSGVEFVDILLDVGLGCGERAGRFHLQGNRCGSEEQSLRDRAAGHALCKVGAEGGVAASGAAGEVARLDRAGEEVLAVIDEHFAVVGDEDFLCAPRIQLLCSLAAVGQTGEDLGLCGVGLEEIEVFQIFELVRPVVEVHQAALVVTEEALNACLTEKTKAIVLNSPCNPTGVILRESSLDAVARAVLGREIFLICDNVYDKLVYAPCGDLTRREDLRPQTILCQSFSKPYAMTGWRGGYLICPEELLSRLLLLSAAEIAAVPTFLQAAAEAALEVDTEPVRLLYRRRRDYVCSRLDRMGLSYPQPEGAFYVFPDISQFGIPSWQFCERMIREAGLAAVPGVCFGTEGYIRLSYCYSDRELQESLDRLEGFVKRLGE